MHKIIWIALQNWLYLGGAADFSGNSYSYLHVDYIAGDTNIGAHAYHKIYEDRYDSIVHNGTGNYVPMDSSKHVLRLFLRESGHTFYKYSTSGDSDVLLINFNQQLNDTVWFMNDGSACSQSYTIVDSIDTVYLGSVARRRFFYSNRNIFLLEGVGTYLGINYGCNGDIGVEGGIYLTCFAQDENTLSLSLYSPCNAQDFATSIPAVAADLSTTIYPNPVNNELNINTACTKCSLSIFNISGERIYAQNALFNARTSINLGDLASGVYWLKIYDVQHGTFTNSMIVKE